MSFGDPPDFTKFSSVQLAKGEYNPVWFIPAEQRKLVAHNLRCFRKVYKHISTNDVVQFMKFKRFALYSRAIDK